MVTKLYASKSNTSPTKLRLVGKDYLIKSSIKDLRMEENIIGQNFIIKTIIMVSYIYEQWIYNHNKQQIEVMAQIAITII